MNLDEIFQQTASRQPEHPAILGPGDATWSYGRLNEAIGAAAHDLRQAGVWPGACIGLHCASGTDYIVWNYATWRCGACVVPIPVELAAGEKQEIVRQIAIDFVVSAQAQAAQLAPVLHGESVRLSPDFLVSPARWLGERPAEFGEINGAFIRFTSGTTGASKGVVLSHQSIFERIQAANQALAIGPRDGIAWLLSMSYHFAVSIVAYLSFGATIVLPANHLAPAVLEAIGRHRATLMYASPMHYAMIADYPRASRLPSLRLALSTTSSLPAATAGRFHERCGVPLSQALGIIEVGLPCINLDFAADKPGSVGRVLPAYELRMEDAGLGPQLKQVAFRGPGFLDAYYRPWQRRSELAPDGWFRTGDIGELDADGCLFLRGRSSDVINVAGMKFFPQEVEAVLLSHPLVAEACVFARADERLGEIPCARVRPRSDAEPNLPSVLRAYCEKRLAAYKVPFRIELVAQLAKTGSGKVLHRDVARP